MSKSRGSLSFLKSSSNFRHHANQYLSGDCFHYTKSHIQEDNPLIIDITKYEVPISLNICIMEANATVKYLHSTVIISRLKSKTLGEASKKFGKVLVNNTTGRVQTSDGNVGNMYTSGLH